ncbi:MAG: hypothetical protein ABL932_19985, partial [Terricaulis sp.]
MRPAWETTPEATQPYLPPRQALSDPRTQAFVPRVTPEQQRQRQELGNLEQRAAGGYTGYAARNQVDEFRQDALEATGIPSWARGIEDLQNNNPGEALPEIAMGGLQTGSLAFLPFDVAAANRAPRAPMGYRPPRLPETAPLPMGATEEMFTPGGNGWLQRQIDVSGRARDLPETADNLGSIRMPQLEVPQSPYDDWLAARRHVLPEMIAAERAHEAAVGPTSLDTIINNTQDPRFSFESMHALGDDLGEYGVGGRLENHPLLGTPEIGADPMARPTRPGFGQRPPTRTAPNEDRYLFGRLPRQPEAASTRPQAPPTRTPDWLVRNPSEEDLARIASRGDEMKYVMDTDGNVYAFSAADGHHNQAMRALRDSGVSVRPLGPGAEVTDPDAAGFIWRNQDGTFTHE